MAELCNPHGSYRGQYATPEHPIDVQSGYGRYDFVAYDVQGNMVISTWTNAPFNFSIERDVYQLRLNNENDHVARVEVYRQHGDWRHPKLLPAHWTMYPQAKATR